MDWLKSLYTPTGERHNGWSLMKLDGALRLSQVRLEWAGLEQHTVEIPSDELRGFKAVVVKDSEAETKTPELRFLLVTTARPDVFIPSWSIVGEASAQMKVWIVEQGELADAAAAENEQGALYHCDLCEQEVPLDEDGKNHTTADGELIPCSHANANPQPSNAPSTLASVQEMRRRKLD